ncbi:hypothetical protein [Bosea sp. Root381]|uniref:hypothetical protein n=1 Tax=Bosea sp. Root381 TaxID=1736524 RepID=UPI0012E3DA3A|nr:hypothetical protein [Bosea sp. Root381]
MRTTLTLIIVSLAMQLSPLSAECVQHSTESLSKAALAVVVGKRCGQSWPGNKDLDAELRRMWQERMCVKDGDDLKRRFADGGYQHSIAEAESEFKRMAISCKQYGSKGAFR